MHTDIAPAFRSHLAPGHDPGTARLREESLRKDVFMATLAHELRNLIGGLSCALEVIEQDRVEDSPAKRRVLPMARRQLQHMSRLVSSLLDVGRMVRGEVLMERTRLAMSSLVSETLEACAPMLAQHVVSVELAREELWVQGDPVRLSQVVTNLLHNAAKFSRPGSGISVQVERRGDHALLHVRDAGVGIAPENLEAIFGLFAQESRHAVAGSDGLGIGLALVRRLTELHGGSVHATSGGAGRGAQFTVTLPLACPPGTEIAGCRPAGAPATYSTISTAPTSSERGSCFDAGNAGQVFLRMARRAVTNGEPPRARLTPIPAHPAGQRQD